MSNARWSRSREITAGLLLIMGVLRYLHSAVSGASSPETWLTLSDQLRPLIEKIWHGTPVAQTIPHMESTFRYGPFFYLIAGPFVSLTRSTQAIHDALLIIAHLCFWTTLYLIDRRMLRSEHWTIRVCAVGIGLNFTPILESLRCACLDTWEMLAITAGFFLFTAGARWGRDLAAAPLVAGILTKLMPVIPLLFVLRRRWRSAFVAAATTLAILAVGHAAYGPEMGFGFPRRALKVMTNFGSQWPVWWENDSPRGLVYKALAGFRLPPGSSASPGGPLRYTYETYFLVLPPALRHGVDLVMTGAAAILVVFVVVRLWQWRPLPEAEELRILGGFSTAIVVHHLVSPYSTHQYLPSTLLAYAFVLCCILRRLVSRIEKAASLASLVLIGTIIPKTALVSIVGLARLNARLHSAPQLDAGQLYTFYGLPGIGLILLAAVVLRLQWKLVAPADESTGNQPAHPAALTIC
jgi:hypothetical protein